MQEYSCCKRINLHACKNAKITRDTKLKVLTLYIAFDRGELFFLFHINLVSKFRKCFFYEY